MLITDFLKFVMVDVPGCPTVVAKQALTDAIIEFLTTSGAWCEIQDPITVSAGVNEYDLSAPSGARCIDIKAIYKQVGELEGVSIERLAQLLPNWQAAVQNPPRYYTRAFDWTTFRIYPMPVDPIVETLTVYGVYTLKDGATSFPDDIATRYREALASGAKSRLMAQPGVAWASPQLAGYHANRFQDGINLARIYAVHGKTAGSVAVRARRFGQP